MFGTSILSAMCRGVVVLAFRKGRGLMVLAPRWCKIDEKGAY